MIGAMQATPIYKCSNCNCDVDIGFPLMPIGLPPIFPYPIVGFPMPMLMTKSKQSIKSIICKKCITHKKYDKELKRLQEICFMYYDLQNEIKEFVQQLQNDFFKSNPLNEEFFNKLISKQELENFLKANQKQHERFKRKSKSLLSSKIDKMIDKYLKSYDKKKVLDKKIVCYEELLKTNKLIPKKNIYTITTCQEAEFYNLLKEANDEFLPLNLETSIKKPITDEIRDKFHSLYY